MKIKMLETVPSNGYMRHAGAIVDVIDDAKGEAQITPYAARQLVDRHAAEYLRDKKATGR